MRLSGIPPGPQGERGHAGGAAAFAALLKALPVTPAGLLPVEAGVVTAGGVAVREIDPRTMESKLVKGLYFAGEVIDVDALTGGYNLQIAWSTALLAAKGVNRNG